MDAIENMIFPDSDVLKAITFSVSYKDNKWVEVLVNAQDIRKEYGLLSSFLVGYLLQGRSIGTD